MVKDGLREGLATSGSTEVAGETEGLVDGQVGLDVEQRSTGTLLLGVDVTTTTGEGTVDTTHGLLGHLDLDVEDGLKQSGVGQHGRGVQDTTSSGDDLTTTTVDGIGVQGHIQDVEANGTQRLLSHGTLTGSPLETRDERVLDFVEVLDGLGLVNQQVGTGGVGTETPDLTGVGNIPAVFVGHETGTGLEVVTGGDLASLNGERKLLAHGSGSEVQTVVLVGRLGEGSHARLGGDSLTVGDDRVGDTERDTGVVLLEILQANLQVQFTGTGDDVLTRLGDVSQDTRVGLGETLETFDQLGQVLGIPDLDGTLDDGGDGELHDLEVVGSLGGGEGTRLEQELVNTNQTDDVTGGDILDGLDETTHHQNGTLDVLDEEVLLLAREVVGTLDADLQTGADGTGVDTTKGVETTLVGSGHHLGDVQHERSLGVTVTDTQSALVVLRTLVQSLGTVALGGDGRGQVDTDHLQHGVRGRQELAHDDLEESLTLEILLVVGQLDVELLDEGADLLTLVVVDSREDLEDGVQDELVEGTLNTVLRGGGPLLGLGVEVVLSPQTLQHLLAVDTELFGVLDSELADGESPAVKTGTESNGTLVGVDLDVTKGLVKVGGDDDVDGLNGTREGLVEVLLGDLQFEQSTVNLVDDQDGLDTLRQGLTQDGLSLDTDTRDTVDDDQGTVSDTESGRDLRREVNVTGRIDQVDQEFRTVDLLRDFLEVLLFRELGIQGDGSRLDGNTPVLFIGTGIHETSLTSLSSRNDTGTLDERVGEGRLSVVDCSSLAYILWRDHLIWESMEHTVSNHGHVTDVGPAVHEGPDLGHC